MSKAPKASPVTVAPLTINAPALVAYRQSVERKNEQELVAELRGLFTTAAESIARMAIVFSVMEGRGYSTDKFRTGIGQYLLAVSSGRLLPEVVARFAGNATVLRACATLALSEQARLLKDGYLEVKRTAKEVVKVPLDKVSPIDTARAIDPVAGRILPPSKQVVRTATRPAQADHRVTITLPYGDFQALTKRAADRGVTVVTLVRDTLRAEGVLA